MSYVVNVDEHDLYKPFERLSVIGIERIITYLPNDLGYILEKFTSPQMNMKRNDDMNDSIDTIGSSLFSSVKIVLHAVDNATHYHVEDYVFGRSNKGRRKVNKEIDQITKKGDKDSHIRFDNLKQSRKEEIESPVVKIPVLVSSIDSSFRSSKGTEQINLNRPIIQRKDLIINEDVGERVICVEVLRKQFRPNQPLSSGTVVFKKVKIDR